MAYLAIGVIFALYWYIRDRDEFSTDVEISIASVVFFIIVFTWPVLLVYWIMKKFSGGSE